MKTFSFSVLIFALWLLLSGHTSSLLLSLGVVSVALTVFLATRMNIIDQESYPTKLFSQLPAFYLYIMREIIKANIDVIKRVLVSNGKDINPQLIELPVPQKTDISRVIYANAVTLTPGTVSIELSRDKMVVHALTKEAADDLLTGEMAKAIPDEVSPK